MKIAISATGPTLDDDIDPRFGRCQYFIIADPETMQFEAMDNSSASAAGGAGISAAQSVAGKGVQALLTGNCGPNAYQVLSSSGIQIITGVTGKVSEAIQDYQSGKFQNSAQPNVPDHFGMSGGMGRGMGGGMGRGMGGGIGRGMGGGMGGGMGMGRGMGGGMGMGAGMMPPVSPPPQPQSPEQEVEALKAQSQMLAQQLSDIQQRLEDLEKKGE
jgi:predicted Fe-Mo cluster-binding NifX family protein